MSIRSKVILIIIAISFGVCLFGTLLTYYFSRPDFLNTISEDMILTSRITAKMVSNELERTKKAIRHAAMYATDPRLVGQEGERTLQILGEISKRNDYLSLAILDPAGPFIVWGNTILDNSFLDTEYGRRALAGETLISTTETGEDDQLVIRLLAPMSDGRVICATLPALIFNDLVAEFKIWETGYIFILDKEGSFVANANAVAVLDRYNYIEMAKTSPGFAPVADLFSRMIKGESGVRRYTFQNIPRISAYVPINGSDGWSLGAVSPISESPVANVPRSHILAGVAVFILGIIAAFMTSGLVAEPYEKIRDQNHALSELRVEAESASEAKSSFLANMSHEMRTPLNAIIGFSEMELGKSEAEENSRKNIPQVPPETHESLEKIYASGVTLLGLINDILDISKIESGKFTLTPVNYDTPSLINDTIALNLVRIGSKPIVFDLDIDENLPSKLYGDELRLKQILNNLLSNSFKYTEKGKVTLSIRCEKEKDYILLLCSVTDTGKGIKKEDLDKLFSNYSQVDMTKNRRIEGTGLGLALTKRLAELMQGSVEVSSVYGQGSVFSFKVRQGFVTDVPIGREVSENLKNFHYIENKRDRNKTIVRAHIPYARVLVVDDVPTNLDVARGMLRPYGMTVDCVDSGKKAIDLIREEKVQYNAIFMDHMMPEMDGIEAVRIIRNEIGSEYARTIPIIALTANAILGNEELFLQNGFQAFLTKPIDIINLNEAVNMWIRNKDLEKELRQTQSFPEPVPEAQGESLMTAFLKKEAPAELNISKVLERFGSGEIWLDTIRTYVASTPIMLSGLRQTDTENRALQPNPKGEGSLDNYRIIVHGIKGASRAIGAEETGRLAEELERAAKEGNMDFIRSHSKAFTENAANLIARLRKLLETADKLFSKPKKPAPNREILAQLLEAAENFNINEVDKAMEELEKYEYETQGDLVPWLREQVGLSEFEQIQERLSSDLAALSLEAE